MSLEKMRYCGHDHILVLSIIMNIPSSFRPGRLHQLPIFGKKDKSAFIIYIGRVQRVSARITLLTHVFSP